MSAQSLDFNHLGFEIRNDLLIKSDGWQMGPTCQDPLINFEYKPSDHLRALEIVQLDDL